MKKKIYCIIIAIIFIVSISNISLGIISTKVEQRFLIMEEGWGRRRKKWNYILFKRKLWLTIRRFNNSN